jgi:hypothetical protein
MKYYKIGFWIVSVSVVILLTYAFSVKSSSPGKTDWNELRASFVNPPESARPGVYWYFMDGNTTKEGMNGDLESMKAAGIGNVLFLEVNVGVPRGKIDFLSEEWKELFKHAVKECERLGIELTLGSGPGWAGSGGPWVKPEQSMRHLVASVKQVEGPKLFNELLEKPAPHKPFFGEEALTESLKKEWLNYYKDVVVLAFPSTKGEGRIADIDEKSLVYRAPYTSAPGVKPYLPAPAEYKENPIDDINPNQIIDITDKLGKDGTLNWTVPKGNWTIMRFGLRNNGAVTRPAPVPGLGFEIDKFDTTHFNSHFEKYIGQLVAKVGSKKEGISGGWTMIHIDSWEMGAQNWSDHFREEFIKRRHYDPLPYLPAYAGKIVGSRETSERFLWDVRQTSMELVLENHAKHFKDLGRRNGFTLSIEPYDMNPTADLNLGAVADVPMCEFWTKGLGFNSSFSCFESTSIAHIYGKSVVGAEAFTADNNEKWMMYPGNVKNQGDWAFCMGINKFVYHTFAHKPWGRKYLPGMTMGPYGVHWDRGQTWWTMASAYHRYITRCQYILRQGTYVADILYLTPEGAPHVFRPPHSALEGDEVLPDKRGYSFDGCSPMALIERADVKDHQIVFPNGTSYRLLVMPDFKTMTPELLQKIEYLLKKGATVVGAPPLKSPSLVGFPECDKTIQVLSRQIWGTLEIPKDEKEITYGQGKIYLGGIYTQVDSTELFPNYQATSAILKKMGVTEDFSSTGEIRYTHRIVDGKNVYFVSNRTDSLVHTICTFRDGTGIPELWNPVSGEMRPLPEYSVNNKKIILPMTFDKAQSYFVVFDNEKKTAAAINDKKVNFPILKQAATLNGSWDLTFDPKWGAPEHVTFDELIDWSKHQDPGIRYYSGKATYRKTFSFSAQNNGKSKFYLDLGKVNNIAHVKLNGSDLGIIWTSPWRIDITEALKASNNELEIEVANLWANRMIGDEQLAYDGVENGQWPEWLTGNKPRVSGRFTFVPWRFYDKNAPLQSSGLLGPVTILQL